MSFRKYALIVISLTVMLLAVLPVSASGEIAILGIRNYSGVTRSQGFDLEQRLPQLTIDGLNKQGPDSFLSASVTAKRLEEAGLTEFKEVINLCSDEDLARIGKKINAAKVGFIQFLGYSEIKRENQQKSYQIQIGLSLIDCSTGERSDWVAEGLGELLSKSMANAVANLVAQYSGGPPVANAGDLRDMNQPVVANLISRKYHLSTCRHLPTAQNRSDFATRKEAEVEGFQACPICYPPFMTGTSYDSSLETELGRESCGTIEYNYRVVNDPEVLSHLEKVCSTLVADTTRHHVTYHFRYLDDDDINAFSSPNGYIYVTRGLMEIIESDDELAFVIAHEMGHIELKHSVIRYKQAIAGAIIGVVLSGNADVGYLMAKLTLAGFSRLQEKEADEVAASHLKRVGRDWTVYRVLFNRLMDLRARRMGAAVIFSNHPEPESRIANLDQQFALYESLLSKLP